MGGIWHRVTICQSPSGGTAFDLFLVPPDSPEKNKS